MWLISDDFCKRNINHFYIPISNYVCTLTRNCFDIVSYSTDGGTESITTSVTHQQEILMAQIKITEKCRSLIIDLVLKSEKLPDVKKNHELKNPAVSVDLIEDRVEVANKELIVKCVSTLRT